MDERRVDSIRFSTSAEINFHVDVEAHRLQMHNVSVRGCMTDAPGGLLLKGRRVVVEILDDIELPAEVMWQRGNVVGLRLLRPMANALLWHLAFRAEATGDDRYAPLDRFGRPLASLPAFPEVLRSLRPIAPDDGAANALQFGGMVRR